MASINNYVDSDRKNQKYFLSEKQYKNEYWKYSSKNFIEHSLQVAVMLVITTAVILFISFFSFSFQIY